MTIDAFISMTENVIAECGLEEYLPTLVLPSRPAVLALQDIPDGVDVENASRNWMAQNLAGSPEDYFLAFKADPQSFKVVVRIGGVPEERTVQFEA